jgi:Ca2+-binding RTX toxin-like protein
MTDSTTSNPAISQTSTALGEIRGFKWNDLNGNGARDSDLVQGQNPDVLFVIDVSGSADEPFDGTPVGDINGDGVANTRLDAQLAGFIALNNQLVRQGFGRRARVGIVVFSGSAAQADLDTGTDGVQLTVNPTTDSDNDGVADVEETLRSITSGAFGVGNNTGTNFEAALQTSRDTFTALGTTSGNGNLIFLSDGERNGGGSVSDEVAQLNAAGVNLSAFGVGEDASLANLREIDPNARIFTTTNELLGVFGDLNQSQGSREPGLAGVTIYLDLNNNGTLDPGEPSQVTATDDPTTPDVDETGQYRFTNLQPGRYVVREVVPTGYEQTFPVGGAVPTGDGFADVVLEYFSAGNAPRGLTEPYGSNGGDPAPEDRLSPSYTVEAVSPNVVLGAPPPSPVVSRNPLVDWLALPQGSYVTVGFRDETVIDSPGDDIFIRSFDAEDSANERADVYISSNGTDFVFLGRINENGLQSLDLADIGFTDPVRAVRIVGVDNRGTSPGFDLISVEVLPNSIGATNYHVVDLAAGQTAGDRNFGNTVARASLDGTSASPPAAIDFSGGQRGRKLNGSNRSDTIRGTGKNDTCNGKGGNDRIFAKGGNDRLFGKNGRDRLTCGSGNDRAFGGAGNDTIKGNAGDDLLQGGKGNDRLLGGAGNDVLIGNQGRDTLIGGGGQDSFTFTSVSDGTDTINDFTLNVDLIDLRSIFSSSLFAGIDVRSRFTEFLRVVQSGVNAQVQIDADGVGAGTTFVTLATLKNIAVDNIDARSFVIS